MSSHERVQEFAPVAGAIAALLSPYAEVVLHDPVTDRVLAVWNPMSPRGPGDQSLLGELDGLNQTDADVFGPYEKIRADGRRLSSVSAVLRSANGAATAVLCINLDRTPLDQAAALLTSFAAPISRRPESLFEQDWTERVQHLVGSFVRQVGRPVERLTRDDRLAVLRELDEAGVLAVRRSTPVVAAALKTSRSTLYTLLADLKKDTP